MDNIKKKILDKSDSYNYYKNGYERLDNKLKNNSKQIDDLNNKFDEFQEKMLGEFNSINLENKKVNSFNKFLCGELNSVIEDNKNMTEEIDVLLKDNKKLIKDLDLLKKENKKLKSNLNKNNKILDSYNENFKLLFYFYELNPKGILKNIQDLCQELLNFISKVCNKHNIEYWIEGGTYLGAVRHGGFLPWDDDIDLGMMRKDYDKFLDVFEIELKNNGLEDSIKYRLLRHGKNILYFVQISCAGIALLDIFPYDYIKSPPDNIKELYDKEKSNFKSNILDGKDYKDSIKELHKNLKLSYDSQPFVIPGVERPGPSPFHVQKTSELFPLKEISFNGVNYTCHKNDDYHLKKLYGDWEALPKVLERHNRIYLFMNRPDRIKRLDESLALLKRKNILFEKL